MKQHLHRTAQAHIVVGMFALALASAALNRIDNDFLPGLGYGVGIGLLALGIYKMRRNRP